MRLSTIPLLLLALPACETEFDVLDEELAAESQAVDDITGKTFLDYLEYAQWKYTPLFKPQLEIETCDKAGAETNDGVQFTIQTGNGVYSYWLSTPNEANYAQGHKTTFTLPSIGSGTMQADDIRLIRVYKEGSNAWCFDRIALKSQGNVFWEWTASDTTKFTGEALRKNTGTGEIWLNTASDNNRSPDVVWTDKTIKFKDEATHGELDLKLTTCDEALTSPLLQQVDVRVQWSHDGFVESKDLKVGGDDNHWPPNHTETFRLHNSVAIENIDWIKIFGKSGNICIAKMQVLANGKSVFNQAINKNAGEMYNPAWKSFVAAEDIVVETGSKVGVIGRPIENIYPAIVNYGWNLSSSARTYCSLPTTITKTDMMKMIETFFTTQAHGKAYWGSGGGVKVTRVDGNTLHVRLDFRGKADVGPDAKVWADWDLDVGCKDTNTSDNDPSKRLVLTPKNFSKDYDVKLWQDVALWFAGKLNLVDVDGVLKKFDVPDEMVFDTGNACPNPTVDSSGNIDLAWPAIPLTNFFCKVNNDHWDEMAAILRRDHGGP